MHRFTAHTPQKMTILGERLETPRVMSRLSAGVLIRNAATFIVAVPILILPSWQYMRKTKGLNRQFLNLKKRHEKSVHQKMEMPERQRNCLQEITRNRNMREDWGRQLLRRKSLIRMIRSLSGNLFSRCLSLWRSRKLISVPLEKPHRTKSLKRNLQSAAS